jgi:thymidylate synthase (FAD)
MKIVEPSIDVTFYVPEDGSTNEQAIERAGRTCYKSEDKITEISAPKFIKMIKKRGHHAMLEFGYATAKIIGDRGLTHELVRHRLASFAQESTRYCNYSKGKFNSEITVVEQPGLDEEQRLVWLDAITEIESAYMRLLELNVPAQIARSVLPIGLKAEIVIGANLREWRHIFKMRCARDAHPIIRGVMLKALKIFHEKIPSLYEDQFVEFLDDHED